MLMAAIPFNQRVKNELVRLHGSERGMIDALRKVGGLPEAKAKRVLEAYPYGEGLSEVSENALIAMGLTPRQAERVHGAFALSRMCDRACQARLRKMSLRDPEAVAKFVRSMIGRKQQEYFVVLLLDARQKVIEADVIHMGTLAQVDVHPREVFRPAIRLGAHSMILAHNHPSGDAVPSEADHRLTERLVDAGAVNGVPVLDHLIVTPEDKFSFASAGMMPRPKA
jgi:DNA repair protein RadC